MYPPFFTLCGLFVSDDEKLKQQSPLTTMCLLESGKVWCRMNVHILETIKLSFFHSLFFLLLCGFKKKRGSLENRGV